MAAQHAMDSPSLRNCTPPASLESPEERRDSMEDADCSPSRFKRPRLDSGSRAVRKMSQDLDHENLAHPAANAPATPMEQHEQTEDPVSRTPNTPSRITLNLRPPQTPSHTRAAAEPSADTHADASEAVNQMTAASDSDSSATLRSSPSASSPNSKIHTPPPDAERTDSALSPGAASSPVVEIAVDDADDMADSSDNVVELNEDDEEEVVFVGDIFEAFPYAKNYGRETALGGLLNLIAKPRKFPFGHDS